MNQFSISQTKDRKGFFFLAGTKSSPEAAERLMQTLIDCGITKDKPETFFIGENGLSVFVYGDDFDMPSFFQQAQMVEQMGFCKVGTFKELPELLGHPDLKNE